MASVQRQVFTSPQKTQTTTSSSGPNTTIGQHQIKQTTAASVQQAPQQKKGSVAPGQSLLRKQYSVAGTQIQQREVSTTTTQQPQSVSIQSASQPSAHQPTSSGKVDKTQHTVTRSSSLLKVNVTKPKESVPTTAETSKLSTESEQEKVLSPTSGRSTSSRKTPRR